MMTEKKILSNMEDLLSADDIEYAEVEVWGQTVRFGSLSAEDMMDFVESNEGPARRTAGIRLIAKSLVDGEGKRIGNEKTLEILKKKNATTISRLVDVVLKLNGMLITAETRKNDSGEAPSDASPTSSPSKLVM